MSVDVTDDTVVSIGLGPTESGICDAACEYVDPYPSGTGRLDIMRIGLGGGGR